jgi:hypothetical protein
MSDLVEPGIYEVDDVTRIATLVVPASYSYQTESLPNAEEAHRATKDDMKEKEKHKESENAPFGSSPVSLKSGRMTPLIEPVDDETRVTTRVLPASYQAEGDATKAKNRHFGSSPVSSESPEALSASAVIDIKVQDIGLQDNKHNVVLPAIQRMPQEENRYPELETLNMYLSAIEQQNKRMVSVLFTGLQDLDNKTLPFFKEMADIYCEIFDFVEMNRGPLRLYANGNILFPDLSPLQSSKEILETFIHRYALNTHPKVYIVHQLIMMTTRTNEMLRSLFRKKDWICVIAIVVAIFLFVLALILVYNS